MIFTQLQGNVEKSHNLQKDKWGKELAKQSLAADI
jgi:hypothetical protein